MRLRVFGLLLAGTWVASPASSSDFAWQGRVAPGRTLEVKGVNGGIVALAASGDEAEVTAEKTARRSDLEGVAVKVVEHEGGVTVCAVYPSSAGRPNECRPGEEGRMSVRDNDVKVAFRVRVPAGVRFVGRTVNGAIAANDLSADVEAYSVNGGVEVSTAGVARAETVNGSVTASMGRADWSGSLELKTVNGSIEVTLPAGAGAEVEARTVNGSIESDHPLTATGRLSRRRLSGTIGGGGRQLALETVNGAIALRRR